MKQEHNNNELDILKAAIDSLFFAIVVDRDGKIVRMSKNYLELLGLKLDDVVGKNIKSIIPDTKCLEVLETGRDQIGSLYTLQNGQPIIANRFALRDGDEIIGVLTGAPFMNIKAITNLSDKLFESEEKNKQYYNEVIKMKDELISKHKIIGESTSLKTLINDLDKVADTDLTILITGETGTGKEVFSNYIQYQSRRRYEPFIKINCAAIPKELLESELFGYEEGAFSGAKKGGKKGKFELANGGTILLDEIGEMSLDMQAKLLRVLQDKSIDRVGSTKQIDIDVRVICATNADLNELVANKQFREDLFYRINGVQIKLPPLRDRKDDIRPLANFFIDKCNRDYGLAVKGIDEDVIEMFKKHVWRGNVRELEHVIERAVIIRKSGLLTIDDFSFFEIYYNEKENNTENLELYSLEELELAKIKELLSRHEYNKTKVAKLLGISRGTLYSKMKKYGL